MAIVKNAPFLTRACTIVDALIQKQFISVALSKMIVHRLSSNLCIVDKKNLLNNFIHDSFEKSVKIMSQVLAVVSSHP